MADEFRTVEQQYFALRSKLAVGRITPAEFEAVVQRLMLRDAQGRYWTLNAQTGKWMVNGGSGWVEAVPGGTAGAVGAPPTLPEEGRARQASAAPGDEFKKAEEQYFALRGRLAAGRITQAQFDASVRALVVRDAQSRTWMLNADTGRWQVYYGRALVEAIPGAPPQSGAPPALPGSASTRMASAPAARNNRTIIIAGLAALLLCGLVLVAVGLALNRGIVPVALGPAPSVLPSPPAATAVSGSAATANAANTATATGTPTLTAPQTPPGSVVVVVTSAPEKLLSPIEFVGRSTGLAQAIADLNRAELKFLQDAKATSALDSGFRIGALALPLFYSPAASILDGDLREVAARAAMVAQMAMTLARTAVAQERGNSAARQMAQHYNSIARWSYALLIDTQNTREALNARKLSPADAVGVIADYGARLWNPSVTVAAPRTHAGGAPANPFLPYVKDRSANAPARFLISDARAQVNSALGNATKLDTWIATTKDFVTKELTLPAPLKKLPDPLAAEALDLLKTAGGENNADAARQVAAAELALLSGAQPPNFQTNAPQTIEFAAKSEMVLANPGPGNASPLPAVSNGVASPASDSPAGDSLLSLLDTGTVPVTLISKTPMKSKNADVSLSIQHVQVSNVDRSTGSGHAALVSYSFQVTWLAVDNSDGYFKRCGTSGYQLQKGPSGIVSYGELLYLDIPGIVAIHCDAVDELGRDGEEIGRASATFLVGDPGEATQAAHMTETADAETATSAAELATGEASGALTEQAMTAQAPAFQTFAAQQTMQAVATEVAGTQTAEFRATATTAARQTATAAANNIFTLVGTFSLSQADSGCSFSTQPSTVGKLTIGVDFNTGKASGTLDGGGGGTRSGLVCPGSGGGDMVWSYTVNGSFGGTVDPTSGALSLQGTINATNPYSYVNCKNTSGSTVKCPAGGSPSGSFPFTLTGTVDKVGRTGKGTMSVSVSLPTSGDWSAGQ